MIHKRIQSFLLILDIGDLVLSQKAESTQNTSKVCFTAVPSNRGVCSHEYIKLNSLAVKRERGEWFDSEKVENESAQTCRNKPEWRKCRTKVRLLQKNYNYPPTKTTIDNECSLVIADHHFLHPMTEPLFNQRNSNMTLRGITA